MILLIILFFIIGILAIVFEAVLPFGISAAFGFAIIALSGYLAYMEFGLNLAILYCIIAFIVAIVVTRMVMRSGLKWMTLAPPKKSAAPPVAPPSGPQPSIGDEARVVAPLRPTGAVEIHGQRVAARSISPEVEVPIGTRVRLASRDSIYWVVEVISGTGGETGNSGD